MLTFIKLQDYVDASPFKEQKDGSLSWTATIDGKTHRGRLTPELVREIVDPDGTVDELRPYFEALELASQDIITINPYTEEERLADLAEEVRAERDYKLLSLDRIVANPLRWDSFTQEQRDEFAAYRLALLDVPQQDGFPESVSWPSLSFTP